MKRRDQLYGGCLCLFGFLLSQVRWLNVSQDHQNQGKRWISTYFIAFISCIRRGEAGKKEKESREEEKPFLFLFFFFPAQQALFDPWSVLKCQNNDFDSCGSSNLDSSFGQAVEEVANWILKRGRGRGEKKKKKKKKPHRDHHASFHSFLFIFAFSFKEGEVTCLKSVLGDSGRSLDCQTVEILILKVFRKKQKKWRVSEKNKCLFFVVPAKVFLCSTCQTYSSLCDLISPLNRSRFKDHADIKLWGSAQ